MKLKSFISIVINNIIIAFSIVIYNISFIRCVSFISRYITSFFLCNKSFYLIIHFINSIIYKLFINLLLFFEGSLNRKFKNRISFFDYHHFFNV